jgi:hypothetical protein
MPTDNAADRPPRAWYPYENDHTVGRRGPEGGTIVRDEELGENRTEDESGTVAKGPDEDEDGLIADARLTLEQQRSNGGDGFVLTATLYGWMAHTRTLPSDEAAAQAAFEAVKPELERLADLLPYDDEPNLDEKVRTLNAAVDEFQRRYP